MSQQLALGLATVGQELAQSSSVVHDGVHTPPVSDAVSSGGVVPVSVTGGVVVGGGDESTTTGESPVLPVSEEPVPGSTGVSALAQPKAPRPSDAAASNERAARGVGLVNFTEVCAG